MKALLHKHIVNTIAVIALVGLPTQMAWAEDGGDGFASLIPLILIMVIFWVLLIRPQQTRMKKQRQLIKDLKKGDKVITGGGFFGQIIDVKESHLVVELADGVRVKAQQDTILGLQNSEK